MREVLLAESLVARDGFGREYNLNLCLLDGDEGKTQSLK
jgi:hypothetical protein